MANAPYFRPALYSLIPTPIEDLTALIGGPMAVTDRLLLLYEPAWVEGEADMTEVATGIGHEIFHYLLHHVARGQAYPDPQKFNLAADLFINDVMRKQFRKTIIDGAEVQVPIWKLPAWVALPEKYGLAPGLSADQYYHLLKDEEKKDGDGSGGDGKGDKDDKSKGKQSRGKTMAGNCGGIAGNPNQLEKGLHEEKGRTEGESRAARKETLHLLNEAEKTQPGTLPGQMSEVLKFSNLPPLVPWEQHMRNITGYVIGMAKSGGLDYSRARPSRRSYLRGWPIPGLVKREFTILIVVDTSASMGAQQLQSAVIEIVGVLRQTGCSDVYLLMVDAAIHGEPRKVSLRDLEELKLEGRGGTSFIPAFEVAEKMKPRPDVVIYMTDGDGVAPKVPPRDTHVIWCIVPTPYGRKPADWGHVVVVSNDQKLREPYGV